MGKTIEQLQEDPEYVKWLHQLTLAGYQREVMIEADHRDAIMAIYFNNTDIQNALDRYIEFKRRWYTLTAQGDKFPYIKDILEDLVQRKNTGYVTVHKTAACGPKQGAIIPGIEYVMPEKGSAT